MDRSLHSVSTSSGSKRTKRARASFLTAPHLTNRTRSRPFASASTTACRIRPLPARQRTCAGYRDGSRPLFGSFSPTVRSPPFRALVAPPSGRSASSSASAPLPAGAVALAPVRAPASAPTSAPALAPRRRRCHQDTDGALCSCSACVALAALRPGLQCHVASCSSVVKPFEETKFLPKAF